MSVECTAEDRGKGKDDEAGSDLPGAVESSDNSGNETEDHRVRLLQSLRSFKPQAPSTKSQPAPPARDQFSSSQASQEQTASIPSKVTSSCPTPSPAARTVVPASKRSYSSTSTSEEEVKKKKQNMPSVSIKKGRPKV